MGEFPIDFMSKGAVHPPIYVNIQKWEVASFFYFHGELYIIVNPIQVVRKSVCFSCPCGQMTKVSSTYLYQQAGLYVTFPVALNSKSSL